MYTAIDILASSYGWAIDDIKEKVYFDDLIPLVEKINARQVSEYKMLLAIVQNPYAKDPQKLWQILKSREPHKVRSEKLDVAGFEALKIRMSQNPRIIVK